VRIRAFADAGMEQPLQGCFFTFIDP